MQNMDWYETLQKPLLTPPDVVFSVVWPILYACMVIAIILVWQKKDAKRLNPTVWFIIQLMFNFLWSPMFFGMQNIGGALIVVVLLLITLTFTIYSFNKVSKLAMYLLVPYWLWVLFATYLNFEIWRMN